MEARRRLFAGAIPALRYIRPRGLFVGARLLDRALPSGGRGPGFVQAATPAWVVFDKSGALTAIKRGR
jgi:hypothetical protein